jgi:6-phosphogluconolactonase (cycloisomerase 2 family)
VTPTYVVCDNGTLFQLGSCPTSGSQAAHAAFSPDSSTCVIAHYHGGKLVFIDTTQSTALAESLQIIDPPELVSGTRKDPNDMDT